MTPPRGYAEIAVPAGKPLVSDAVRRAGLSIEMLDGAWIVPETQAAAVQAVVDAYDPLPDAKAQARAAVDAERQRRGALVLPDDPDTRWQAGWQATLLVYKIARGLALSAAEQAKEAGFLALAQAGTALDDAADAMLADIDALDDADAVLAYPVADSPLWPAT